MNKVYVLDTGALYNLQQKKRNSPIRNILDEAGRDSNIVIYIPSVVVAEANQIAELHKATMAFFNQENIGPLNEYVANRAAEGLRLVARGKCDKCNGFNGPSLVDAIVMAFAQEYCNSRNEAIVCTSDMGDMQALKDVYFEEVQLVKI